MLKKISRKNFLVGLTTTKGSDWRAKIREIDELGIEKLALFVTCLNENERKECYQLLEKTSLKEIPFCHIRSDMPFEELDYLVKRWQTKVFNLHTRKEFAFKYDYDNSPYKDKIYIENVYFGLPEEEVKKFAGICLDLAHLENDRLIRSEVFENSLKMLEKYPIGCNHISGIFAVPEEIIEDSGVIRYDKHFFTTLKDFDYLKRYPLKYFSKSCALEVENPFKEQLEAIEYIYQLLN